MHAAITHVHETVAADSRERLLLNIFKAHTNHEKIILFESIFKITKCRLS